ncbi:1,4-dihydroxy-6-naphthoate synthase [Enhygromyxa salina]|uniref:1,4-dihydroxy-6-naphtoate synthase n=1 Tax=Enhygromyxa salina TaxID=215803 RepID=A0A2S9YRF4_9BACT|nr:1,4-dihydroxy-6-naphthoate synthase [Enhygromyxa salina]PRQ07675.1 1,4-dihydroxy-6-naphtoate synthase [Enhygromyxa salina]
MPELDVGFSSCPNDTFMFHGLMSGQVEVPGVRLRAAIADIEALNLRALGHGPGGDPRLPVTKLSAHALAHLCDRYTVLGSGAALGRGCGPLVVRREADAQLDELGALRGRTVAIPGEYTTAHLLLRTFFAETRAAPLSVELMRFDQIMPAVAEGRVDAGLIIHESRFTYPDHGLVELADLGVLWEQATGLPIPLGMICAERRLAPALIDALEHGLRDSIELAFADPSRSRAWIREHAQELDDEVCRQHIELYVNAFSVELGDEGRAAIDELLARGRASGFLPPAASPWR